MNVLTMNNIFNELVQGYSDGEDPWSRYHCRENESSYEYELNLAGFKKKDIEVSVEENVLSVAASNGDREFCRKFSVPKNADASSSSARYEDGVLYFKVNKKENAKKIELEVE
jgi:HSP20 family protein